MGWGIGGTSGYNPTRITAEPPWSAEHGMGNETGRPPGRRQFARFPVFYAAAFRDEHFPGKEISGSVRDIGDGGLMAEFPVQMPCGSAMGLVLQTRRGPLSVEGRVVWTAATQEMTRHGIAFPEPQSMGFALDLFLAAGARGHSFSQPNLS